MLRCAMAKSPAPRAADCRSGATKTAPDAVKGGTLEEPDVVTSLLLYGTETQYPLPRLIKSLWIGSSATDCGILVRSDIVSGKHCQLVRDWPQLRVTDTSSKNGTWHDGVRERAFYLNPGKTFTVGGLPHRFLALNDHMRANHVELVDILGGEDEHAIKSETPSPSELILAAMDGGHILIASERDCEQERLGRIIHAVSRLRTQPLLELNDVSMAPEAQRDILERKAGRSTLLLNLDQNVDTLSNAFVAGLFSAPHQVRVIAFARNVDVANEALGKKHVPMMQRLWIRPLAQRSGAIPRLLDRLLEELGSPLRVSHLAPENQQALRTRRWPENFTSLRQAAAYLAAIARLGTPNKAAHALGVPPATFYNWYSKIMGFSKHLMHASDWS